MKKLTLEEIAAAIGVRAVDKLPRIGVSRICTDSRDLRHGDLFFALPGQQFDGHDFVDAALSGGAVAAVVADVGRVPSRWRDAGRLIVVPDTVDALGRLAGYHRTQSAAAVIGVVGSNGKTTTKELIHAVLRSRKSGQAAAKSFNNHIGVPLTLLSIDAADEYVVVEIGTNRPGEVSALAQIARPDLGVVTSIGEEHLEFLGDLSGVAEEELSLLAHIRRRGWAVLNHECRVRPQVARRQDLSVLSFGFHPDADLRASDVTVVDGRQRFRVNGRFEYELPALGVHNVSNALAAIAVGLRFGLPHADIAAALSKAALPPQRLEPSRVGDVLVINDAYNANPASMRAALATLDQLPPRGRRVLLLGDMRELGADALRYHEELGRAAGRSSAAVIVAIGAFARNVADGAISTAGTGKRIYWHPSIETAGPALERLLEPGDIVLLKGSRAVRMERLISFIERSAITRVPA